MWLSPEFPYAAATITVVKFGLSMAWGGLFRIGVPEAGGSKLLRNNASRLEGAVKHPSRTMDPKPIALYLQVDGADVRRFRSPQGLLRTMLRTLLVR